MVMKKLSNSIFLHPIAHSIFLTSKIQDLQGLIGLQKVRQGLGRGLIQLVPSEEEFAHVLIVEQASGQAFDPF